jgi:hypothetical protein
VTLERKLWQNGSSKGAKWQQTFTEENNPPWPCPICKHGKLVVEKSSIKKGPSAETRREWSEDCWEPEMYEGSFCCLMTCNWRHCLQTVAVAGEAEESLEYDGYVSVFRPRYFYPAPDLLRLPQGCTKDIQTEVRPAFALYWCDLNSCLNHIRTAVDLLLTEMGVKRFPKNGRRKPLTLHSRIETLRKKQQKLSSLCDSLLAVKWLGNEGSHSGEVTSSDVLDAFDILEYVLQERFANSHSIIAKLSRVINKRKGPRTKRS